MFKRTLFITAAMGLLTTTVPVHANGFAFHPAPMMSQPVYRPPVYTAPAPVFRAPAPVYRPPAPVYRPPAQVYQPPQPRFVTGRPGVLPQAPRGTGPGHYVPGPKVVTGHTGAGRPIYSRGPARYIAGGAVVGAAAAYGSGGNPWDADAGMFTVINQSSNTVVLVSVGNSGPIGVNIPPGSSQDITTLQPVSCDPYVLHAEDQNAAPWDASYSPCNAQGGYTWTLTDP